MQAQQDLLQEVQNSYEVKLTSIKNQCVPVKAVHLPVHDMQLH